MLRRLEIKSKVNMVTAGRLIANAVIVILGGRMISIPKIPYETADISELGTESYRAKKTHLLYRTIAAGTEE